MDSVTYFIFLSSVFVVIAIGDIVRNLPELLLKFKEGCNPTLSTLNFTLLLSTDMVEVNLILIYFLP